MQKKNLNVGIAPQFAPSINSCELSKSDRKGNGSVTRRQVDDVAKVLKVSRLNENSEEVLSLNNTAPLSLGKNPAIGTTPNNINSKKPRIQGLFRAVFK